MECKKCGAKVGKLSNYGNDENPLCYDCATEHDNHIDNVNNINCADSKDNECPKLDKSIKKLPTPKYINPVSVLGLTAEDVFDHKNIRKAIKRLQADISLSDGQVVKYKRHSITPSILHEIDKQLSDDESIECHSFIAATPAALAFFEEAKLSEDLLSSLENRPDILKFIPDFYANSYSIAYLAALQVWNIEELALMRSLSRFLDPAYIEEAYSPSEKHLMWLAQKISDIAKAASSKSEIEPDCIRDSLKDLLFDSRQFDLTVLPSVFDNELDSIAGRLRALAILSHNKFGHTKFAMQINKIALLLSKSPSVIATLEDDLKTLREVDIKTVERDKKFRNDITTILKNAFDSVQEYGKEGINHSKLDEMFVEVFKPGIVAAIMQDTNEQFRRAIEDYVLQIIRLLGYQYSKTLINTFRPLFEGSSDSNNALNSLIDEAKRADSGAATKKAVSGVLRATVPFIGIGGLLLIGFICELFDGSESSSKPNRTAKQPSVGNSYNSQNSTPKMLTPEDVSEEYVVVGQYRCRQYHASELDNLKPDVNMKRHIDSEEAYLNSESDAIEALAARIEYLASHLEARNVDNTDQYEVDSYNADVNTYNQLLEAHRSRVSRINSRKAAYSSLISTYNTEVDKYNNYLEANCTKSR